MRQLLSILVFLSAAAEPAPVPERPFSFGAVRFEENRGQAAPGISFLGRARGHHVYLQGSDIVLSTGSGPEVRISFDGASVPRWTPDGARTDSISYYLGNDPSKWIKGAPVYNRVAWRGIYQGIDLVLYGNQDRLEYDLVLAPNADPSRVRLRFSGSTQPTLLSGGAIEIAGILQHAPHIYQQSASGARTAVSGRFAPAGPGLFALQLGAYDRSLPLTIDPVLEASSYYGGENDDEITAITDGFVGGNTRSVGFVGATPALRRTRDIFVRYTGPPPTKSQNLLFPGTVIAGGSGDDELSSLVFFEEGLPRLLVGGTTGSTDFPAPAGSYKGGESDGFIFTFSLGYDGSPGTLSKTALFGGSGADSVTAIAYSRSIVAVAGTTDSPDLPVNSAFQPSFAGGKDSFVAVGTYGTAPSNWALSYLGGSGDDRAHAVGIQWLPSPVIWVAGQTSSTGFPNARSQLQGPSDAFLTRISPILFGGGESAQATFLIGGSGDDAIKSIVVAPSSFAGRATYAVAYPTLPARVGFAGFTTSPDLGIAGPGQASHGGGTDAFAGAWDIQASSPAWLTYLGGSGPDEANAVTQNNYGDFYVGGWTASADLPVLHPLQASSNGGEDGLFAAYHLDGSPIHVSYFGGAGNDRVRAVSLLDKYQLRLAGSSDSSDLPSASALPLARGSRMEGFTAEVGTDHFISLPELAIPKDGMVSYSVVTGRSDYRDGFTVRSSDPSLVRIVQDGRSAAEATVIPGTSFYIEALADSGEAELILSGPSLITRRVRVRLFPGAFFAPSSGATYGTWVSGWSLYAPYTAYDPATGRAVGSAASLRPGVPRPKLMWSSSDRSIISISQGGDNFYTDFLRPGSAQLTLSVEGYTVFNSPVQFNVASPAIADAAPVRIGKDLRVNVPISLTVTGVPGGFVGSPRGTLTARSSDPSRLLLSAGLFGQSPAAETVKLAMHDRSSLYAEALAAEGEVEIVISSPEFETEFRRKVVLEPAVLYWGALSWVNPWQPPDPLVRMTAGARADAVTMQFRGESGTLGERRAGAPLTLKLSSSDPSVIQISRLSAELSKQNFALQALSAGFSDLVLTTSDAGLRVHNPTTRFEVSPQSQTVSGLPATAIVAQGLQSAVKFNLSSITEQRIAVASSDPDALLVSSSLLGRGSAEIGLVRQEGDSSSVSFYLQGLKSPGAATVRVAVDGIEEKVIQVTLLPGGIGLSNAGSTLVRVAPWAFDPETGVPIAIQIPGPGDSIPVRLRVEGAPVSLAVETVELTPLVPYKEVAYPTPARGSESVIIAEPQIVVPAVPGNSRYTVRGEPPAAVRLTKSTYAIPRHEMTRIQFDRVTGQEVTITSGDPSRLLISQSANQAGAPSVVFTGKETFYAHALADSGVVTLGFSSPGLPAATATVFLRPVQLFIDSADVRVGAQQQVNASISSSYDSLRYSSAPGYTIRLRTADPSIATVHPETIQLPPPQGAGSTPLTITGVSVGATDLLIEGAPDVLPSWTSPLLRVSVSQPFINTYSLGRNLQGGLDLYLGESFVNPNGAIVTVSSSDPSRLLVSRSDSAPGSASINVAVPAGSQSTPRVFFHALEDSGTVDVNISGSGDPRTALRISLSPSYLACTSPIRVTVGLKTTVTCAVPNFEGSHSLRDVTVRPGLDDYTVRFSSSNPSVFTVDPASLTLQPGSNQSALQITGASEGEGELTVQVPSGFGPPPANPLPVVVSLPNLPIQCGSELQLSRGTQATCLLTLPSGVVATATSAHPDLLAVSVDRLTAGAASATVTSTGSAMQFSIQALASYGTGEIVFSAPGYRPLRVPAALSPPVIVPASSNRVINLTVNSELNFEYLLRTLTGSTVLASPGSAISAGLSASPDGIVSVQPARLQFAPGESGGRVLIRALAPGITTLRLTPSDGVVTKAVPLTVTVTP